MVANTQSKVDQHFTKEYLRLILKESYAISSEDTSPQAKEARAWYKNEIKLTRDYLKANKGNLPISKAGRAKV